MASAPILVGTAGWSYPDWENLVYPPGQTAGRLRLMAQYLDCVEVDSSFYRPPAARAAELDPGRRKPPAIPFPGKGMATVYARTFVALDKGGIRAVHHRLGTAARERSARLTPVPIPVVIP